MRRNKRKYCTGFTLMELMVTMSISSILMLVVGVLIVSAIVGWQQTYNMGHKQIDEDATTVALAFGKIGRMANRANYVIYSVAGSTFTPATSPTPSVDTVVSGGAVEFRYWDVELDVTDSHQLMDVTKKGTAYALFYLNGGQLKVDYGQYPPGGVPAAGGVKNNANIKTVVLARNVQAGPGIGAFSHTSLSGVGKGCVRTNIILTDPNDGRQERIMTSVMMRNKWPQ
jgi:prepilin-type N-terminal cleavage/methylation domain-containing protein